MPLQPGPVPGRQIGAEVVNAAEELGVGLGAPDRRRLSPRTAGYAKNVSGGASEDEVHVVLSDGPLAAGEARQAVRAVLAGWRLQGLLDEVTLVVSELVTNAVRHGLPPVRLVLTRVARELRVDVHDEGAGRPSRRIVPEESESGRGLAIVEAVTRSTGVEQSEDDGKVVYATFDVPAERPTTQ